MPRKLLVDFVIWSQEYKRLWTSAMALSHDGGSCWESEMLCLATVAGICFTTSFAISIGHKTQLYNTKTVKLPLGTFPNV